MYCLSLSGKILTLREFSASEVEKSTFGREESRGVNFSRNLRNAGKIQKSPSPRLRPIRISSYLFSFSSSF